MSLRNKADQVYKQGVLERGEFSPSADAWHLKLYKYWERVTAAKVPKTENFCHYWRVVALWAPLNFLGQFFNGLLNKDKTWLVCVALYVLVSLLTSIFISPWALLMLAVPYVLVSVLAGGISIDLGEFLPWNPDDSDGKGVRAFLLSLTPIAGLIYFGWQGIKRSANYVATQLNRIPPMSARTEQAVTWLLLLFGTLALLTLATVLGLYGFNQLGVNLLYYIGGVLVMGAVVWFVGGFVFDWVDRKIAAKQKYETERREKYVKGEISYDEYFGTREPTKFDLWLKKVGKGIVDTFMLVFNWIRVKKWKVCPTVNIPADVVPE